MRRLGSWGGEDEREKLSGSLYSALIIKQHEHLQVRESQIQTNKPISSPVQEGNMQWH